VKSKGLRGKGELVMCNRDENASTRRERRGDRCSVYPKCPPAAYKPTASSLGAGPGEPDSALKTTVGLIANTTLDRRSRSPEDEP